MPHWIHQSWRASLGVLALAVPWLIVRSLGVVEGAEEPESLGEGAAQGLFAAGAISVGVGLAALLAICLLTVLVVDLTVPWSKPAAAIAALLTSIPWFAVFALAAIVDGIIPTIFLAATSLVAILSVSHLILLGNSRSTTPPPAVLPPWDQASTPPPPKPNQRSTAEC